MAEQSTRSVYLIDVNPKEELAFNYVIQRTVTSFVSIKNLYNGTIAYKMKTNKPDSYLVKPHEGVLFEGQAIQVEITMQPTDFNPQTGILDDKFLVAALVLPPNPDPKLIPPLWKSTPSNKQHHTKLKVVLRVEGDQSNPSTPTVINTDTNPRESDSRPTYINRPTTVTESNESTNTRESSVMYKSILPTNEDQTNPPTKVSPLEETKTDDTLPRKFTFGIERGSPQHVAFLETDLAEVKRERDRIKSELEQSNIRLKVQDKFVVQLSEDKTKLENELNMLKNSTFKLRKESDPDIKEVKTDLELWHAIVVAIISMVIGGFLFKRG